MTRISAIVLLIALSPALPRTYGEESPPVPIEELALSSPIILRGHISATAELATPELGHRLMAVKIVEVLKGKIERAETKIGDPHTQVVMIVTQTHGAVERWEERYRAGEGRWFFVRPAEGTLLIETALSNDNPTYYPSPELQDRILKALREDSKVDVSEWRIPADATEKVRELNPAEASPGVGIGVNRIVEYWLDDQQVGRREWWSNGQMSFEGPMRYGRFHGLTRRWAADGTLLQQSCYRFSRRHGPSKSQDGEIFYYVRGREVSKERYVKEAARDKTLPTVDTTVCQ